MECHFIAALMIGVTLSFGFLALGVVMMFDFDFSAGVPLFIFSGLGFSTAFVFFLGVREIEEARKRGR